MATSLAWTGQGVPPVSGLGQSVGSKTETYFRLHDVVDDFLVFPRVHIVNQLGALIAEEPGVFELGGAFHGLQRY